MCGDGQEGCAGWAVCRVLSSMIELRQTRCVPAAETHLRPFCFQSRAAPPSNDAGVTGTPPPLLARPGMWPASPANKTSIASQAGISWFRTTFSCKAEQAPKGLLPQV